MIDHDAAADLWDRYKRGERNVFTRRLYTLQGQQAFDDIRRALKPDGVFVTYNYFRQGWVVERIAAMMKTAFGCEPTVLTLPYQETLAPSSPAVK